MGGKLSRRNKDCFVGQSIVFSQISVAHTSAEDIEQRKSYGLFGSIVPVPR
jgi:hypothetical protein